MTGRPNLVLVGFMGAGKSAVGRRAAELLDLVFVDSDAVIEAEAGMSIPEIFAAEGEAGFRARERAILTQLASERDLALATGGGAFVDETVRRTLKASGVTVYLHAPFEVLWARVGSQPGRPLLAGEGAMERARALYASRQAAYREADATVDASQALDDVTAAVVEVYRDRTRHENH